MKLRKKIDIFSHKTVINKFNKDNKINIINSIDKTKPRWYYIVNPKENKISNQKRFNIRYDQKN
jgi:hypothetical protein